MVTIQGNRYMSDFEAKKAMTEIGRRMDQKGYAIAGDGSLSVRTGPNAVWITVAGADKGNLTQEMFVKVGMDGRQVMSARSKELPEELESHLKVYREKPEAKAVIQAYPPAANARALCGQPMDFACYTGAVKALGAVMAVCGTDDMDQAVRTCNGVLTKNMGCLTWAGTLLDAYHHMEAMEYHAVMDRCLGDADGCTPSVCAPVLPAMPVCETVPMPEQIPALKGVTALVKPVIEKPAPVRGFVPQEECEKKASVMSNVVTASHLAPDFALAKAQTVQEAPAVRAVDVPREDVMAEVVRRMTATL